MNENLQKLEVKIENQGTTPQGKVSAAEWNILVAAVKALDAAGIDIETLAKYLKQYQYITTPKLEELLKDVTENLDGVVDLKSAQTIEGLKDFINGFKIGGALVKYDPAKKCFIFTENVLIEKGLAWNSRFDDFTEEEIFSITKAVDVDWETIGKRADGKLYVIPNGSAGGGGGNYDPDFLHNYLTNNNYITSSALEPYAKTDVVNSLLTEYLPKSGGAMTGQISLDAKGWYPSFAYMNNGVRYGEIGFSAKGVAAVYDETAWRPILHSGNYSDYTLPITGGTVNGNITATGNVSAQSVIVNGKTISYNVSKNAFVLTGNLLVEGGIAWNAKIDGFDVPTITDAVSVDGVSIIRDGGVLRVSPDYIQSVGGLNENELANYLTNNNYAKKSDIPSLSGYATESFVVSQGYITQPTLADALTPYAKTENVNSLLTEYLPKSGGAMTGQIFLDAKGWYPSFAYMNNGVRYGEIGFSAKGVAAVYDETAWRPILHSGNYSDYALPITGNAASATKLATPRSIWGQTFDGTDDVAGFLSGVTYLRYSGTGARIYIKGSNYTEQTLTDSDIGIKANNVVLSGNLSAYHLSSTSANINGTLGVLEKVIIGGYRETTEALEVEGNILATGRIAWNSSRVLKTEVKEHYLSLDKLMQIKPYSYKWKDGRDNLVHVGAIADEVMEPLPETVLTDALGIHSMDYAQTAFIMGASLTPYVDKHERELIECKETIKEQGETIIAQAKRIRALEIELKTLKRVA